MIYDFLIIGGGVVGTATADRLARFDAKVLLLEKQDDVAAASSRANSGIVHAGYDCEPNTLKARFNVRGNQLMWQAAAELHVPHKKCASIVVGRADQLGKIEALREKAEMNGVPVKVLDRKATLHIEPNISKEIEYSLYAPTAGVISPYKLTIAFADRAVLNGAEIITEAGVTAISKKGDVFQVSTAKGVFEAKTVINCAGAACAAINDMIGAEHYETEFRRGDYFVLDNKEGRNIETVIFPLPTEAGKGILVAPTADGNVIYGPTSVLTAEGDTVVTREALDEIKKNVPLTYARPAFNQCIRIYAGVRTIIGHDFIVKESDKIKGFFMAAGICSPGLTSAPAIAEYIEELVGKATRLIPKANVIVDLPKKHKLTEMGEDELRAVINDNPDFGRIVCRCEKVTEAEVIAAIHSPLPATTVDAVKRRVRAGMGRCQGGFCATRVMQILAKELDIPLTAVRKGAAGSEIAVCGVKEVGDEKL